MDRMFLLRIVVVATAWVACQAEMSCNFEWGMCGYRQDTDGVDFDWLRQNGSSSVEGTGTGPAVDHSSGTTQGYYLFAQANSQTSGDRARIITPPRAATQSQCIQFYYYMYGDDTGSLTVYVRRNDTTALGDAAYTRTGQQGKGWYLGLVDLASDRGKFLELIFEARIGEGQLADIAIDDVAVFDNDGSCPLDDLLCDFEKGFCGIVQDKTDDFDFIRQRGGTTSSGTGPGADHTTGNGYYVYIEATGATKFHKARLISPIFRGVQPNDKETFCVIFWYHMLGSTVGELNVYLHNSSSTNLGSPIWWMAGNRGDLWRAGEAEINTPEDFQLYFEAVRGSNYDSDIALDDIQITSYGCPGHHIIKNESSVSCDFEEAELCYYKQDNSDDFDWTWRNRGTNDGFTGPDVDHTRGDELGFFVFVTSNYRLKPTHKARLISPPIKANTRKSCVVIWYHMYGRDVETLNVYVRSIDVALGDPQWTISGDQGNYWHRHAMDIAASTTDSELVFEALPGEQNRDDIAIDDIVLYNGADCPSFTTQPPKTTKPPVVVDSIDCNFEEGWCGYVQMAEGDQMDWFRYQGTGAGTNSYYGPKKDHTLGNALGYYASFDPYAYNGAGLDDDAALISPLIGGSRRARCLQFYANMNGYSVDYIQVYTRRYGETLPLDPPFYEYGNHGEGWFLLQMDIPGLNQNFQVIFVGICGRSKYSSEIAVDDIKLVQGACDLSAATAKPVTWNADCDFELDESLCGYTNEVSRYGKFAWTRNSGGTGSEGTGPSFDHTLGTDKGHYVYIESSLPQRPDDKAVLSSPTLNSRGDDLCVRFYYHAHGEDVGLLAMTVTTLDLNVKTVLFSLNGDQGDEWRPANVDLPGNLIGMSNFVIGIEGRKGSGFKGDVAVDDIKFLAQPCEGYPTETTCTFEQGTSYCGYYQISQISDVVPWKWFDTLATEDSPLNSVATSFMYVEGSASNMNKQAILYSQFHDLLGVDHCLTADLVLTDDSSQQIKIEAMEKAPAQNKYAVGTLSGDLGRSWFRGNWSLPLTLISKPFQFVFTATAGTGGVLAIDNVIVTTQLESCAKYIPPPTEPPTTTPSPTTPAQPTTGITKPMMSTTPPQGVRPPGNSKLGIIIGVTLAVIVVIAVVVIVLVCKFRSGVAMPFGISYNI